MDSRRTAGALLWLLAVSSIVGTVTYLVLGMDLAVKPPDPSPTLDFAGRIEAFVPYLQARWPLELLAGVAFIVAFGTLAVLAGVLALAVTGADSLRGVFATALIAAGTLGIASNAVDLGALRLVSGVPYCDCVLKTEELISRFWAGELIGGAASWLSYAALIAASIGVVALSAALGRRIPDGVRYLAWLGAGLLVASVVLHETTDQIYGDIALGIATILVLPAWAIWLASRIRTAVPEGAPPSV